MGDTFDTIIGTTSHPGLLDDIHTRANSTLSIKGFHSQHVDSKDEFDERVKLVTSLSALVTRGEYFSVYDNATLPFLPRVIGCTQQIDFFKPFLGSEDDIDATFINVPTVKSRTKDLKDIAKAKIKLLEGSLDLNNVQLSKEAIKRLLDNRWGVEGNAELDLELYKALEQLSKSKRRRFGIFSLPTW